MSTTTKTWAWPSSADGWTFTPGTSETGAYEGGAGNPVGSIVSELSVKNKAGNGHWDISGTWADLFGIPTGATVTHVRIYGLDTRCTGYLYVDAARYSTGGASTVGGLQYVATTTLELWAGRIVSGVEGSWTSTGAGTNVEVLTQDQPATSTVGFRLNVYLDTANTNGAYVRLLHDNLVVEITYTSSQQYQEAGTMAGIGVGFGADQLDAGDAASLFAASVSIGADQLDAADEGTASGVVIASGVDGIGWSDGGTMLATSVVSGADQLDASDGGTAAGIGVGAGVDQLDAGDAASQLALGIVSGDDVLAGLDAASVFAASVSIGADQLDAADSGTVLAASVVAGADVFAGLDAALQLALGIVSGDDVYPPAGGGPPVWNDDLLILIA